MASEWAENLAERLRWMQEIVEKQHAAKDQLQADYNDIQEALDKILEENIQLNRAIWKLLDAHYTHAGVAFKQKRFLELLGEKEQDW